MTRVSKRPSLRTVRLLLHPGTHGTSWALVIRTDNGHTVFDRRLHSGLLDGVGRVDGPSDLSSTLRAVADEIDRRWASSPASGGSGAPGGGGGRPDAHPRGSAPDRPLATP